MWSIAGKERTPLEREELLRRVDGFDRVLVDVGTGDGRFVYRWAREHPEALAIGFDAVAEAMRATSSRAARKPTRGGLSNVLFVHAAAEELPGPLAGTADLLTVNYPWGSLLAAVVEPDPERLARLLAVTRPGAAISILINYTVFEDPAYLERLGLPALPLERVHGELVPAYRRLGVEIATVELLADDAPRRTSWGRRLVAGSGRKTLVLEGTRVDGP